MSTLRPETLIRRPVAVLLFLVGVTMGLARSMPEAVAALPPSPPPTNQATVHASARSDGPVESGQADCPDPGFRHGMARRVIDRAYGLALTGLAVLDVTRDYVRELDALVFGHDKARRFMARRDARPGDARVADRSGADPMEPAAAVNEEDLPPVPDSTG